MLTNVCFKPRVLWGRDRTPQLQYRTPTLLRQSEVESVLLVSGLGPILIGRTGDSMLKLVKKHWEQAFFGIVGLIFLTFSFNGLLTENVAEASATFAMAFLSFIYANVSRFKRFKGLGFEAELWEDKQKEAEQLIDLLKEVVSVYTREIVMGRVKQGRWGDGANWSEIWSLYRELVDKHSDLGQDIDFRDLKRNMDQYFIFDLVLCQVGGMRKPIWDGRGKARKAIEKEFGSPIRDNAGYSCRFDQLRDIPENLDNMFEIAQEDDLAARVLDWGKVCKEKLKRDLSVIIELDDEAVVALIAISRLHSAGPIEVTPDLISRTVEKE